MSYSFIDGNGAVQSAESSVVVGSAQRQVVTVGSTLTTLPVTFSGNITIGSILSSVPNQSVSGAVTLGGGQSSVSGVGVFNTNHIGNGSVQAVLLNSSVTALQGTNPWQVNHTGAGSVMVSGNQAVGVAATTNPVRVGAVDPYGSIKGLVTAPDGDLRVQNHTSVIALGDGVTNSLSLLVDEDDAGVMTTTTAPYIFNGATWDRLRGNTTGLFINPTNTSIFTGFRNDAVASTVGVNLTSRLIATDSAGRTLIKPFAPDEARVQSVIATNNTTTTSLLAAGGAGLRTYVTDAFVTNTGSVATLVSFTDGDNSVIGRTIAPATGGSNLHMATPMRTGGFAHTVNVTMATAVSTLGVTALGYYAP